MTTGITFQPKKTINITPIILVLIGIAVVIFIIAVIYDLAKNKKKDKKMYCKKCGTKIDDDSIFCYMCGTNVTSQLEPEKPENPKETPKNPHGQPLKKEELEGMGFKPILAIAAITLGFFSILAVLLFNLDFI